MFGGGGGQPVGMPMPGLNSAERVWRVLCVCRVCVCVGWGGGLPANCFCSLINSKAGEERAAPSPCISTT